MQSPCVKLAQLKFVAFNFHQFDLISHITVYDIEVFIALTFNHNGYAKTKVLYAKKFAYVINVDLVQYFDLSKFPP